MSQTYFSGPGKAFLGTVGFQPEGVNGGIHVAVEEKTDVRASAQSGELFETLADQVGKVSLTPFDNWNLLPTLFPPYLGVTTAVGAGFGSGALAIGTDIYATTKALGVVGSDGSKYPFKRGAITKHPSMKLLPGASLFGSIEMTALGVLGVNPGVVDFLFEDTTLPGDGVIDAAGTDPDAVGFGIADFAQTNWTVDAAVGWGTIFGAAEAEDGWEIVPEIKYNMITIQKVSRICKLASARFMIKGRLSSPNASWHTTLAKKIMLHTSGGILSQQTDLSGTGALTLKLNGSNGKTITLANCEPKGFPMDFGGTKLRTGEIGFVTTIKPTAVPGGASTHPPSLIFSA